MSDKRPLPFRIKVPDYDSINSDGIVSISIRLEGLLNVVDATLSLEWTATRKVESVSLEGITDEVEQSPVGSCRVPMSEILEARLKGGWWAPRLVLRARSLDAFAEIPTAENGIAILRIQRRDREQAKAIVHATEVARQLPGRGSA